jgi:ubiquinol-cytochrome c reductase cytochrome b subunit
MITTYWGFYIDPDRTKSLLERLVIDPIFLYTVMALLVPLSFGFTYLMIKLAKNADIKAKSQKKSGEKSSIQLPEKWLYIVFVALIGFQVYLNIAAYYAVLNGMKNYSLFLIGIIMLVFAGLFHLFRYGKSIPKSNVEVISSDRHRFNFPSFGNRKSLPSVPGLDSSRGELTESISSGSKSKIGLAGENERKPIESPPEIKSSKSSGKVDSSLPSSTSSPYRSSPSSSNTKSNTTAQSAPPSSP